MSEYPEHIDQIDDFYRSQLADHEIEPPEALWDKISMGAFGTQSQEADAASSFHFTKTQKYFGLLAASVILIIGSYYYYVSTQELPMENDTAPVIEQPLEQHYNKDTPATQQENETESNSSTHQLNTEKDAPASLHKKEGESVIIPSVENTAKEHPTETAPVVNIPQEEQKADSTTEIKTTQKTPKEKVKFKDKYKKEYQDSTRKIFVPGK